MKKLLVVFFIALSNSLILNASVPLNLNVSEQKTYSQRTYTLFPDGHYERKTCYSDGSCEPLEQGFFKIPQKGDYKHIEEIWLDGKWQQTVVQNY